MTALLPQVADERLGSMIFSRLSMVLHRDQVRRLPPAFGGVGEGFRSADEGCRALLVEMGLTRPAGEQASAGSDLPVAALAAPGEAADGAEPGHWLCADPVVLLADRDRLLLHQWRDLGLDAEAWNEIAVLANQYLAEVGVFIATGDGHGYLRLHEPPGITTVAPWRLRDGDVDSGLPVGSNALAWRSRMNEMQMALHGAAFNARREVAGLPLVNGLWYWGGGELTGPANDVPRTVCATADLAGDPIIRGMARRLGGSVVALPEVAGDWQAFLAGVSAAGQGRAAGPGWAFWELPAALAREDADAGSPPGRATGPGVAGLVKAAMASVKRGELGGLDLWVFDGEGGGHYRMDSAWRWWRNRLGSGGKAHG